MKKTFRYLLIGVVRAISLLCPIRKRVFCICFFGKQYSDNPRAITEKLHIKYPDYQIAWYIRKEYYANNKFLIPSDFKVVSSLFWYYFYLFTSFCVIKNDVFGKTDFKRKKQFFIQTWHGDRGFKKVLCEIGVDANGRHGGINDMNVVDLAVAGSTYGVNKYKTAFLYNGSIYSNGCPRNDLLLRDDDALSKRIKNLLGIDTTKKVLLYAPTFRKNNEIVSINDDILQISQVLGDQWQVLIRSHSDSKGFVDNNSRFIDVSNYPDMADLLFISEALITDYSSSALDYVLKKKPIVLFCPDLDYYSTRIRDFKIHPEESGLIVAKTRNQLLSFLENMDNIDFAEVYKKCEAVYGITESGHASEEVCDIINEAYKKSKSGRGFYIDRN